MVQIVGSPCRTWARGRVRARSSETSLRTYFTQRPRESAGCGRWVDGPERRSRMASGRRHSQPSQGRHPWEKAAIVKPWVWP